MSQYDPPKFWQPGQGGGMVKFTVVPCQGKSGNDYDESRQGRITIYPSNWPQGLDQNPLLAHVMSKQKGPFGEDVHSEILDGMQGLCTILPDGTPLIHDMLPSQAGPPVGPGAKSYVGAPDEKG